MRERLLFSITRAVIMSNGGKCKSFGKIRSTIASISVDFIRISYGSKKVTQKKESTEKKERKKKRKLRLTWGLPQWCKDYEACKPISHVLLHFRILFLFLRTYALSSR